MFQRIEEFNRAVWGDKIVLATTAHALGGLGIGLLVNRETAERAKSVAYALIGLSMAAHLYALLTMSGVPRATRERTLSCV